MKCPFPETKGEPMKIAFLMIFALMVAGSAFARDSDKTIFGSPYFYTVPTTSPGPAQSRPQHIAVAPGRSSAGSG